MSLRVRFHGETLLFIGDALEAGGPLTTEERFVHGEISLAHLYPDGHISQYGRAIGSRADCEILEAVPTPVPTAEAAGKLLMRLGERLGGWL